MKNLQLKIRTHSLIKLLAFNCFMLLFLNVNAICHLQENNFTTSVNGNSVSIVLSGTGYNSYLVGWSDGTYNTSLTHTYTSTGVKTICVRFKDSTANGYCDTTICKTVTITAQFTCQLQSVNFTTVVNGDTVRITRSGGGYTSYLIGYGDGTYGTNTTHVYSSTGTKTICVKFIDSTSLGSCDTTICKTITIPPHTTFTCPLQNTNFTTSVNGNSVSIVLSGTGYNSYLVGWSDGTYNTSLTHTYTSTGVKTICVRFKDSTANGSCDTTICKTITITGTQFTCQLQSVNFTTAVSGDTVRITRSGGGYTSYLIGYGDGTYGTNTTHVYSSTGTKTICVKFIDSTSLGSCDTTICKTITIPPHTTFTCPLQNTNFTTSVNGNSVSIALSGTGYNSYLVGWSDGTYNTSLTHTYTTTGVKTICVRFKDSTANGYCDTTICKTVTITAQFTCQLQSVNFTTAVNGDTVRITQSGGGYTSYLIGYGDGTYGTNTTHVYSSTGTKTICVKFIDSTSLGSCDTTICKTITIPPHTTFTCPLQNTNFTTSVNSNSVSITLSGTGYNSYLVGWSDGTYNTSLTHTYTSTGVKTICVRFKDSTANGYCDTTICKTVTITAQFTCQLQSVNFTTVVIGDTVRITRSGGGYTSYLIGYGDGTYGTNTTHVYSSTGTKTICVKFIDSTSLGSCDTTICKTITIPPHTTFTCPLQNTNFTTSVNGNSVSIVLSGTGYNSYLVGWSDGTYNTSLTHTYTSTGVKTICVRFKDSTANGSCDTTICKTITINNSVCSWPNLFTTIWDSCTASNRSLYGYSTLNTCYKYQWKVNGVIVGTTRMLTYSVTQNGTYNVCLTITDTCTHCDTSICSTRTITCIPSVTPCNWQSRNVYVNFWDSCTATNKSLNGYIYIANPANSCYKYQWKVNGVAAGTTRPFTYPVTQNGTYNVCVTVTDTCNHCDTTYCSTRTITCFNNWTCPLHETNFTTTVNGNSVSIALSGTGYNSYLVGWSDGTYNTSLTHTYTSTGVKTICVRFKDSTANGSCDTTICKTITIVSICDSSTCVLPGDADHDFTVNNFDIFAIGLSYNRTGLTRSNATTQYTLQPSPDWSSTHYYGFNDKFADCNGDGSIKNTDASVILQNYIVKPFNQFNHRVNNDSLPPVFLAFDSLPVFQIGNPCNTTEIVSDINVGLPGQIANDVYGIGFSVDYPASFATDSCFKIQVDLDANSWFATNEPILYLFKNIPEFHRVDVGIARTNGIARSGNGRIGRIKFVVEDGIFRNGRVSSNKQYTFAVNNVDAINGNGIEVGLSGRSTTTNFIILGVQNKKIEGLKIFPNPVTNYLNINANEMLDEVLVTDVTGKVVFNEAVNSMNKTIDFSNLSKGMYMIEIRTKNAVSTVKIIKAE